VHNRNGDRAIKGWDPNWRRKVPKRNPHERRLRAPEWETEAADSKYA